MRRALDVALVSVVFTLGCTSPNPEYPEQNTCVLGERRCEAKETAVALVCGRDAEDRQVFVSEPCPQSALCESGRCVPGLGARGCEKLADCTPQETCTPLVIAGTAILGAFCVPLTAGLLPAGAACSKDTDCSTYRCLQQSQGKFCFHPCGSAQHCGPNRSCLSLSITVTGIQGQVKTCAGAN